MPKVGMLVQMDSSQHKWLAHIDEKWWLIAMIDDANNEVSCASLEIYPKVKLILSLSRLSLIFQYRI